MNDHIEFLNRKDCVLLLVDIQKVLFDFCVDKENVQKHAAALIDICQLLSVPIIFTEQNAEKLGPFVPDLLKHANGAQVLNKMEFSCFQNATIAQAVAAFKRRTILLAGLETHICIFHTGVDAIRDGYRLHVASDAVTSRNHSNRAVGLNRLQRAGAVISSTEMIIYELLNRAGTPEFRKALPVLKTL
ncbi:MAG: isochorismatase family protein [Desulfobacterales bacterium]|nr:isochorismatase family protein [Desulfobacterales bacterium]